MKKPNNANDLKPRVFARLLSQEITLDKTKQISGGNGMDNGLWQDQGKGKGKGSGKPKDCCYWTNNEKFKAWDCCW